MEKPLILCSKISWHTIQTFKTFTSTCSLLFKFQRDGDYLFAGRRKHYNFVGAIGHKQGIFFSSPFLNCFFLFRWTWPSQVATSTPTSSSRWSPSWSTPGRARSSWGRRERESTIWSSSTASSTSCPACTQLSISLLGLFSGNVVYVVLNTQ